MENNNLDIIAHAYNGIKHDNSVPDGKITEAKLADEVNTKLNNAIPKTDIVDNLEDTSSDKPISARAVNVDMVDYVDASISDTMLYINQEIASEHAGRVAGDNLLNARIDEVEEVTATALCDLDSRVNTVNVELTKKSDNIPVESYIGGYFILRMSPNVFYKITGGSIELDITLDPPTDDTIVNEYMLEFISGSTPTHLSLPASVKGIDNTAIEANKIYHVSIVNNVGVIYGVDNA